MRWDRAVLIFVLLLLLLGWISRDYWQPRVYERAAATRLAADKIADLGPGLHVILVGTGSPLPDEARAGPMTAVIADGQLFIFDVGSGSVRNLGEFGYSPARAKAVFLTHLHSDHIDGLGELMLTRWAGAGANAPLPIYGPEPVATVVDGFEQAYAPDRGYRIAHHGEAVVPPSGFGGEPIPIEAGEVMTFGRTQITAIAVDHAPIDLAFGYLIEHAGRRVFITGDSTADIAFPDDDGLDLLVAEALNRDMVRTLENAARENGQPRLATIFHDIQDYHMSPAEADALGERLGAERVVLTHIVPAAPNGLTRRLFMKGADAQLGYDGLTISLSPNDEE